MANVREGIAFDEIVSLMRQRRSQDSILFSQGIEVRDRYNGDVVIPLTDVDGKPVLDPPTPRLIAQGIDGIAMRAASVRPSIICPWLDGTSERSRKRAETRRKMLYSTWHYSTMELKAYRSYRHLSAYGTCAWVAMPDDDDRSARIELRDPLTAYPELRAPDDVREPKNVGFIYGRSIDWIQAHYPEAREFLANAGQRNWDTLWDMVEWIDEDELVVGILGPRMPSYSPQDSRPYGYNGYELRRWKNKAGMVPVAIPRRATLDRIMGQMSTLVSTMDLYTRHMALATVAAEKHTFPDIVVKSAPNMMATVNSGSGQWHDGRSGKVNIVQDGDAAFMVSQPPPFILEMIHELEGGIRESGGASGFFGGDNPGGLRTGRALDTMGNFAIDPRVEEVQKIEARALTQINKACIAVEKGYFPNKKYVSFTGLPGDNAVVEYEPAVDLESMENVVEYPIPGADVNQMSVALAQLVGSKLMSARTARIKHPVIDDADQEERLIELESASNAVFTSFEQQAAQGNLPLRDAARVMQLLRQGQPIEEALLTAQQEAQDRQAAQAPPPGQGQGASPQQMPGLAMPGQGVESQPPDQGPIPPPPQALRNFQQLAAALKARPNPQALNAPANA